MLKRSCGARIGALILAITCTAGLASCTKNPTASATAAAPSATKSFTWPPNPVPAQAAPPIGGPYDSAKPEPIIGADAAPVAEEPYRCRSMANPYPDGIGIDRFTHQLVARVITSCFLVPPLRFLLSMAVWVQQPNGNWKTEKSLLKEAFFIPELYPHYSVTSLRFTCEAGTYDMSFFALGIDVTGDSFASEAKATVPITVARSQC